MPSKESVIPECWDGWAPLTQKWVNAEKAMEIIHEFERRLPTDKGGSISFFTAVIYSALDEKQEAMKWLTRKAYKDHDMEMPWLMTGATVL